MRYRHLIRFYVLISAVLIGLFALVQALEVPLLTEPQAWMEEGGFLAGLVSTSLLGLDVFLPVPSSVLMTLNGTLFGVGLGVLVSLVGCLLSGGIALGAGRSSRPLLRRIAAEGEMRGARRGLKRWGIAALVFTRPLPVLAEATAIAAAAGGMKTGPFLLGIFLGSLPIALLYAVAGALATDFQTGLWIMVGVVVLSLICWRIGLVISARTEQKASHAVR